MNSKQWNWILGTSPAGKTFVHPTPTVQPHRAVSTLQLGNRNQLVWETSAETPNLTASAAHSQQPTCQHPTFVTSQNLTSLPACLVNFTAVNCFSISPPHPPYCLSLYPPVSPLSVQQNNCCFAGIHTHKHKHIM